MLFRSFILSLSLLIPHFISFIIFDYNVSFILSFLFYSLIIFPLFCGLCRGSLFYITLKHYFKFALLGLFFVSLLILSGFVFNIIGLYLIFIIPKQYIYLGYFSLILLTILWLFFISFFIMIPRFANFSFFKSIKLSIQSTKGERIRAVFLIIKTFILTILIIPAPFAIKSLAYKTGYVGD